MARRQLVAAAVAALALTALTPVPASARARHRARTWYVRAGAPASGTGSRRSPLPTLAAAERHARAGAEIVVLPAPLSVAPLEGGIALKPRQRLVGAGPSVLRKGLLALPRIENTLAADDSGDAVRLADATTVRNLVIGPAVRGDVYGAEVTGVRILGNDLSHANTGCTTGIVVAPFTLPTLAAGVGAPFSSGLSNGWATVMLDATHAGSRVSVIGNFVHDATCADGIDIRAMGASHVTATVRRNTVTALQESPSMQSVLAIGMQTLDTATLHAHVVGNTETEIGSAIYQGQGDADSEGLFANSAGRSRLIEQASDNTFAHGLGHLSANCFEAAASNGGPTMEITLDHSTCNDVPGDLLEADNLSSRSTMDFTVDHVLAEHTNWIGAPVMEQAEPGDDGDCMLEVASGAQSNTDVRIEHSTLQDCAADGLGVLSNVVTGAGPVRSLRFSVLDSRIAHVSGDALRVGWATPVTTLAGEVQDSALVDSNASAVLLESLETSGTTRPQIDLGGGSQRSAGENCIESAASPDIELLRANVTAEHDWWGQPGRPGAGHVVAIDGTLDDSGPLTRPPNQGC